MYGNHIINDSPSIRIHIYPDNTVKKLLKAHFSYAVQWWQKWEDRDKKDETTSCYLVYFFILLILLCSPMQTFFIEDRKVIDRWLYFCKRCKKSDGTTKLPFFHLSYYKSLQMQISNITRAPDLSKGFLLFEDYRTLQLKEVPRGAVLFLTDASQCSSQPLPWAATHRHVAAPPAVVSIHTAVDHNTPVMPHHLWLGNDGNRATFGYRKTTTLVN